MSRQLSVALLLLLPAACDGTPDSPVDAAVMRDAGSEPEPIDWPAAAPPARSEPEPGIVREVLRVPGHSAAANPSTGDATPAELNQTQLVRFAPSDEPEVRAVIVAMPGIFGGAGTFEFLARHLVRLGVESGEPVEVWAIDRRSNLLEDLRGLDAAEVAENPAVARGYYFGDDTVGGETFPGFVGQPDVPFMSEWGLETHLEDLRAVIALVPEVHRRARTFLMGHSLGASMTETFASWRFADGTRGAELVAGLILVDGVASTEALEEDEYRGGSMGPFGSVPGVDAIRSSTRYIALPLLGLEVYPRAEIAAMQALFAPEAIEDDRGRDEVLSALMALSVRRIPAMTNAAAFGWAFDDASNGLSFAAVAMGQPAGGAVESYEAIFGGTLTRPSEPDATYTWIDALDADPPERTPLANLAHSWIDGPTNFAEWYFPVRLSLDLAATAGLELAEDGWQAAEGLRAFDGALVDAPILAVASALAPPSAFDALRARIAPVGDGRVRAGASRDTDDGFRVVDATDQTHIDPLTGADAGDGSVPAEVLSFVLRHAEDGRTASPLSE